MFNKRVINKRYTLTACEAICLFAAVYATSYLLRQNGSGFPMSINAAWYWFSHWTKHFHLLAVALLPIYVALMVFGTAVIGIYLGSAIQRSINFFWKMK